MPCEHVFTFKLTDIKPFNRRLAGDNRMVLEPKKLLKSVVGMVCFLAASLGYGAEPYKPTVSRCSSISVQNGSETRSLNLSALGCLLGCRTGEWYARKLHEEGGEDYAYHLEHYGHPSEFGYKILFHFGRPRTLTLTPCWPFLNVPVRNILHHVRFIMTTDLWDSKHHQWNAVAMGPKRDIIGAGGMPHSRRACGLV